MAVTNYFQPKFEQNHVGKKAINFTTDTFKAGLIKAGTLAARGTAEGYEFVSDLLANGGSALTEETAAGYARATVSSPTLTVSGLVVTFDCADIVFTGPFTFSDLYAFIWDETASSATDATRPLLCIVDFGGAVTGTSTSLTLTINASGLVTWTVSP